MSSNTKSKYTTNTIGALILFAVLCAAIFWPRTHPARAPNQPTGRESFATCIQTTFLQQALANETRAAEIASAFDVATGAKLTDEMQSRTIQQTLSNEAQLQIIAGCANTSQRALPRDVVVSVVSVQPVDQATVSVGGEFESCVTAAGTGKCRLVIAAGRLTGGVQFTVARSGYMLNAEDAARTFSATQLETPVVLHLAALAPVDINVRGTDGAPKARVQVRPYYSQHYWSNTCEVQKTDRADKSYKLEWTDENGLARFYFADASGKVGVPTHDELSKVELIFGNNSRDCILDEWHVAQMSHCDGHEKGPSCAARYAAELRGCQNKIGVALNECNAGAERRRRDCEGG